MLEKKSRIISLRRNSLRKNSLKGDGALGPSSFASRGELNCFLFLKHILAKILTKKRSDKNINSFNRKDSFRLIELDEIDPVLRYGVQI